MSIITLNLCVCIIKIIYIYFKIIFILSFKSIIFFDVWTTQTAWTAPHRTAILWCGLRGFYITRCGCGLRIFPNRMRGLVRGFRKKPHRPHREHPYLLPILWGAPHRHAFRATVMCSLGTSLWLTFRAMCGPFFFFFLSAVSWW